MPNEQTIRRLKKVWEVTMILLLNILIIVAAVAPSYSVTREEKNESVQVLSKLGSRGNEVRQVQTKLKSLGYYTGKVDGIYGTGTQSAVKKIPKKIAASQSMALPGRKLCYISALPIAAVPPEARENIARVISTSSRV